ncbi:MAG: type III pantothenate kinase, partial [Ferruginibacter sp.]|nr:type III pantothenate kinase [Cytophagales bacterium]
MNLAIDAGNTFVKLAAFEGDTLVETWEGLTEEAAVARCRVLRPVAVLLSSVGAPVPALREAIRAVSDQAYVLTPTTPVPLVNHYETPETLGTDRLAAAVGAKAL